jgi:hypothetical protein
MPQSDVLLRGPAVGHHCVSLWRQPPSLYQSQELPSIAVQVIIRS